MSIVLKYPVSQTKNLDGRELSYKNFVCYFVAYLKRYMFMSKALTIGASFGPLTYKVQRFQDLGVSSIRKEFAEGILQSTHLI